MKQFINDLRSSILFITILPAGKNVPWSPDGMARFFPVVGMLLGFFLLVFDALVSFFWPPFAVAVLDMVLLVVMTGAFHLDGLGDAADGLFSHRPKERVLEIMKDSHTGMMGLVAIFCILSIKTAGIYAVKTSCTQLETMALLFFIPAYSRATMIFGIRFFDYGRKGTGTGLDLFQRPLKTSDFIFVLILAALSLILGPKCLVINLTFVISMVAVLGFYKAKLNCITGDMLGAMTEVTEAVLFMVAGASFF